MARRNILTDEFYMSVHSETEAIEIVKTLGISYYYVKNYHNGRIQLRTDGEGALKLFTDGYSPKNTRKQGYYESGYVKYKYPAKPKEEKSLRGEIKISRRSIDLGAIG